MKNSKTTFIVMIIIGVALAIGTLLYVVNAQTSGEDIGLGTWILEALGAVSSVIAIVTGIAGMKKSSAPTTSGDHSPVHTGKGDVIQTEGGDYVKEKHVHLPLEKEHAPRPRFGDIPAPKTDNEYVLRGIENDIVSELNARRKAVIVSGMGGVGKSEMAKH
jgi:hypothetical protein